jgi:predicted MFS family arabinose efflux permease
MLAVLRLVLNTGYRMVYPFLPVFARGLGVELGAVSLIISVRSLIGALGPFLGTIADSRGRKTGMLAGVVLFTLGTFVVAVWPALLPFALALILITLGKAIFDPSMHAYVGDIVPYQARGGAIAIIEMSWSISFILGIPFMGYLIDRNGWQSPFTVLGFLGLLTLLILARYLPGRLLTAADQPGNKKPFWHHLQVVFTNRLALLGIAFSVLTAASNESINVIFGVWIEASFGLQLAALGAASAVIGFSELAGESLAGLITDRLGKMRAITAGVLLNCLAAVLLPVLGGSLAGALAGLFFFYITFEFTLVSTLPVMTEILPSARATLLAAGIGAFSLGRAIGAALAVPLFAAGFWANSTMSVTLNLLALLVLVQLGRALQTNSAAA